ncbi:MAG: hypothetical protein HYT41_01245 [Candidatus Sungbacteria bacterium]|nr:hypothetical protein [Candidatus Sungbacteria bacterium]
MYWWIWWMAAFGGIFSIFTFLGLMNPKGFLRIGDVFPWLQPLTSRLGAWFQAKIDEDSVWLVEAAWFSVLAFVAIDVSIWVAFGWVALVALHRPRTFDANVQIVYEQINALRERFKIAPLVMSWSAEKIVIALSGRRFLETGFSQLFAAHVAAVASIVIGISLLIGWWAGMVICIYGTAAFLWEVFGGEEVFVEDQSAPEEAGSQN